MTKKSSGELSVWTKLSSINVNENTEKKGMLPISLGLGLGVS